MGRGAQHPGRARIRRRHVAAVAAEVLDAILADQLDALGGLAVPESYRAVVVRKDEQNMFEGVATKEKDPRKSLHVEDVALPELGPGRFLGLVPYFAWPGILPVG